MSGARLARLALAAFAMCGLPVFAQSPSKPFTYKQTPQGPLNLFVDYPAGWKASDARAAIVFFYGGGWTNGTIDNFARQSAHFASRGLVSIRADYRIASRDRTEPNAAVEDGRSAMRWVRAHAKDLGVDPTRLVAAGASSGGHLAACAAQCALDASGDDARVSPRPDALVLFNPTVDFVETMHSPTMARAPVQFTALMKDTALLRRISPSAHVQRGDPPVLLLIGTRDPFVDAGRAYIGAMTAAGVRAELFMAEGAEHGFFNSAEWYGKTLARTEAFLASLGYLDARTPAKRN